MIQNKPPYDPFEELKTAERLLDEYSPTGDGDRDFYAAISTLNSGKSTGFLQTNNV